MESLHELKEMLCEELDKIAEKGELSAGSLETLHKLTDTIKNIDKIEMLEEDGYSGDGGWMARGNYSRDDSYDNDDSYARRGMHYVRGHYSRGNGSSYANRDGRGGYSREDGKQMVQRMEDMMQYARNDKEREAIRRCINQLER